MFKFAIWRCSLISRINSGDFVEVLESEEETIATAKIVATKINSLEYVEVRRVEYCESGPISVTTGYKRYLVGGKEIPENMTLTDVINTITFNF